MITKGLYTSSSDRWETPQWLFDKYNERFHFTTDVCADEKNAKCKNFYSVEDDGLKQNWEGSCWCNPPYGREIGLWMEKAYKSSLFGATVICLIPARTDTRWWVNWATRGHIEFVKGRLKFNNKGSAPFPSAVIIYHAKLPSWGIFEDLDNISKMKIWGIDRIPIMAPWLLTEIEKYKKLAERCNIKLETDDEIADRIYKI